jgi:transcriptional regulator with XRE-family HTH domain
MARNGPLEADVGNRIRVRRLMVGMSQGALGAKLGVTFQQIQKYEKGATRVSTSRLQQIADALGVVPSYFFGNGKTGNNDNDAEMKLMATPGAVDLLRAYAGIKPNLRRAVVALAEILNAAEKP